MSRCKVCRKVFHPDYIVVKNIRGDEVKSCIFCHLDKKELTITDDNGKFVENVTKDQASRAYLGYLRDLVKQPKIAELLTKANPE